MSKKNQWTVKMVNPQQIAKKKYRGCGTTQAVKSFCMRYRVNCFWWTPPTGGKKIFMIDLQNFRNYWKLVYGAQSKHTGRKPAHASRHTRRSWGAHAKNSRTKYRRAA